MNGISSPNTNCDEVIDKKALGIDDYDLGEIQEVQEKVFVTQKGILDNNKFYYKKTGRQIRWSLSVVLSPTSFPLSSSHKPIKPV
jgi:hypothetical protein